MKLSEALWQWNTETLSQYVKLLGGKIPSQKAQRIDFLCERMLDKESLRGIWDSMDPLSQRVVSVAYHSGGVLNELAFEAQYGKLPAKQATRFSYYYSHKREPQCRDLFLSGVYIPQDLMPLLEDLILPLERFQIEGQETLPRTVKLRKADVELIVAETETSGRIDILTYLQLVEQNELRWSQGKEELVANSIRKLNDRLVDGDFPVEPSSLTARTVIRPFGLDVFCRAAGWVAAGALTEAGRRYLRTHDPDLFLEGFERWTEQGTYDELKRIAQLKGVTSRVNYLTKPGSRREKIVEALSWCPTGTWISLDDFFRAVKIWQFDFVVEQSSYSELWAGPYKQYGQMGDDYWDIVHGLYIKAVIMEYLATIGAVDIAYVWGDVSTLAAATNYIDTALSLHDGLLYLRINDWGAYLFGQSKSYTPQTTRRDLFEIDETLTITPVTDWRPNEQLLLETITEPDRSRSWRLGAFQLLTAVDHGQDFDYLARFLVENHRGEPPAALTDFLARLRRNLSAFREEKTQLIAIRLGRPEAREVVEQDPVLSALCRPLDDVSIVVRASQIGKVRIRLKELGYLLREA